MADRRTHSIALASPAARTADGQSTAFEVSRFAEGIVFVDVTAASGTAPTLDLEVEAGPADDDLGYVHTAAAQITGAGKFLVRVTNFGPWVRLAWKIGGTAPSFTFGATLVVKT